MRAPVRVDFDPYSGWGLVWHAGHVLGRVRQLADGSGFAFFAGPFNVDHPGVARPTIPELLVDIEAEFCD